MSKLSVPRVHPALQKHSEMFKTSRIIKVTDYVYVAFNYAIANMIMIEGKILCLFIRTI